MKKRYKNPPLIEAVCEFRFDPSSPWDLAIPGLFYEQVKNSYPVKRPISSIEVVVRSIPSQQFAAPFVPPSVQQMDRIQFLGDDEKSVLMLGPHVISIHRLAPYTRWEDYEPSIARALQVYREVARPKGLSRIGLKFQNLINIPQRSIRMEEYFAFYPALGEPLPQEHGAFLVGVVLPFDGGENQLRLELQSGIPSKEDTYSVLLSMDYYTAEKNQVAWSGITSWIVNGHIKIEEVFEGCILESTRALFGSQGESR